MATVRLSPLFNGWQGFGSTGLPLSGGLLYTYAAGTTTPSATYTDNTGTVQNANPIVLGSDGRPPNEIWLVSGNGYKFVLQNSLTVQLGSYDNIAGIPDISANNVWTGTNVFSGGTPTAFTAGIQVSTSGRFQGDFSNASIPSRSLFTTFVANGVSEVSVVPQGSATEAGWSAFADPTPANCKTARFAVDGGGVSIESNTIGAGVLGPMRFNMGASEVMRFSATNKQLLLGTTFESSTTNVLFRVAGTGFVQFDNISAISVNLGGANQTGVATSTFTKVLLNTVVFNQNTSFNTGTSRFVPPAGKYIITCNAQFTNLSAVARTATLLYKNGTVIHGNNVYGTTGQASGATVSAVVDANGTDYFELFAWHNSGNPEVLSGLVQDCFMTAAKIG